MRDVGHREDTHRRHRLVPAVGCMTVALAGASFTAAPVPVGAASNPSPGGSRGGVPVSTDRRERLPAASGDVPSVTGVAPTSGPMSGGTLVTISGTGLGAATTVLFGSVAARAVTVVSDTRATATSPAEPQGVVNIRVKTPGGTSPSTAADRFRIRPPVPTVTGVTPAWGPASGGTAVTITGTNLTGATSVLFGGAAATFAVDSSTMVTAVSPVEGVGPQNVRVVTPGGASPEGGADPFLVQPVGYPFCGTRTGRPTTTKLLVVYEENHGAASIYGSAAAPTINAYADDCGRALDYRALTHPSLPNYLASTSGDSYASAPWNTDCDPVGSCLTPNENIFHQVGPSGWKAYAESMSGDCATTGTEYAARHNPAEYYTDVAAQCATNDVPMGTPTSGTLASDLAAGTLPTFGTVTPNLDDDMHDGTVARADAWLAGWLPVITAGPDYQTGDLAVVIVWDEGSGSGNLPSTVPMIAISPYVTPGTSSTSAFTHASLLKAAEDIAGVGELPGAASAGDLRAAFGF